MLKHTHQLLLCVPTPEFWADYDSDQQREALEGPIRGAALLEQGHFVLHGSCVALGKVVVAVVGPSGTGKSTLAAILVHRGAMLVSDGMTPIHPVTLGVTLGPPRTKLDDESLRLLGEEPLQFPRVHSKSMKRYFPVPSVAASAGACAGWAGSLSASNTANEPLSLRLILIVEDAEETEIVPIAGAAALIELIKNVYLVKCLPTEHSLLLMQRAAAVIQRGVVVKALRRKKDPSRLLEIAEVIEREVASLQGRRIDLNEPL